MMKVALDGYLVEYYRLFCNLNRSHKFLPYNTSMDANLKFKCLDLNYKTYFYSKLIHIGLRFINQAQVFLINEI